MDIQQACVIMEIDMNKLHLLTQKTLKITYRQMALKTHPDKNKSPDATKQFQQVGEAYNMILEELNMEDSNDSDDCDIDRGDESNQNTEYTHIFQSFVKSIVKGEYNDILTIAVQKIIGNCDDITIKLFEGMDRDRAMLIYDFIIKYKLALHIDDSIIQKVKDLIVKKYDNVDIYTVNPTIDDIIENNVFKLDVEGKTYFVPLWHSELLFEKPNKSDLIVKCIPILPENITIDENNNIIVVINITFSYSLFDMGNIEFFIGKKRYNIPLDCLKVVPIQQYVFYNKGITKINGDNIYNVEDCGDVIAMVHFVY